MFIASDIHSGIFRSLKQCPEIHRELATNQLFNDFAGEKTFVFAKLNLFDSLSKTLEVITASDGYLPLSSPGFVCLHPTNTSNPFHHRLNRKISYHHQDGNRIHSSHLS
jgi:hypothetical protein